MASYPRRQQERIDAGECRLCGVARGKTGTEIHCNLCAEGAAESAQLRRSNLRRKGLCINCGRERGARGTADMCRKCANDNSRRTSAAAAAKRSLTTPSEQGTLENNNLSDVGYNPPREAGNDQRRV